MREIKFREEITYRIDDWLITTNVTMLRADSKGWYKENGYVMRKVNNHPRQNKRGYVAEHRLVYEKYLGRFLDDKEVIHHINGDRADNRIENLQIAVGNSEHIKEKHKKSRNTNGQFVCENPVFNNIKFRLFDKDRKITIIYTLNKLIATTFRRSKFDFRGSFTGLKDKNDKEIYEGDILLRELYSSRDNSLFLKAYFVVEFREEGGFYMVKQYEQRDYKNWKKEYEKYKQLLGSNFGVKLSEVKVIGNIYENPELLGDD